MRVLSADAIMNIKFLSLSLSPSPSLAYIKITITISSLLINYSLNCCHLSLNSYYSDRGSCVKCYLSCDTCSGPRRDQCVRCPNGWKLAAGECHPECPEGFFKTEFGCQKCHHYCKTCNGESLIDKGLIVVTDSLLYTQVPVHYRALLVPHISCSRVACAQNV